MRNFKHILFPVDLSAQCREAAPFVKAMAQRFGADVTLLHAMEIPPYWFGTMGAESFATMVDLPKLTAQRREEFDSFLVSEFAGFPVTRILQENDPAAAIEETAARLGTDLIMMPTHGYGPFRRLLIGSVTAKVLHDVTCPVWTGVHAERQATHPDQIHSMMCAVGLNDGSQALVALAAELASLYGAELRLVHAVAAGQGSPDEYFDSELDAFLMNLAHEGLAKLQSATGTAFEVCVARGDIAHVVREAALHHDADLVVIGRGVMQKTLGRLRTHTYSIIREAPCPVLSV